MGGNYSNDFDFTDTGNWNSAKLYSEVMIATPLFEAKIYERIARFGTNEFEELPFLDETLKQKKRLDAIVWLVDTLQVIINNSTFALKSKDKPKVLEYLEKLQEMEELLPSLQIKKENLGRLMIKIDEDKFKTMLKHLTRIRRELKEPLNRADLIFTHVEEFDPKAWKAAAIHEMSTRG